MTEEAYVSFEVAKLLIEKGFNEPTLAYAYAQDMISYYNRPRVTDPLSIEAGRIPLPTQQMAMRWLREVHAMGIAIGAANTYNEGVGYYWHITDNHPGVKWLSGSTYCRTYEEAAEAAIKYCLENLIDKED